jgi:hypothetical protein
MTFSIENVIRNNPNILIHIGSNVLSDPFFRPNTSDKIFCAYAPANSEINLFSDIDELGKRKNKNLYKIYQGISNKDHGMIINDWVFLSPKEIVRYYKIHNRNWIDIAILYNNKNDIKMLCYIISTDTFFICDFEKKKINCKFDPVILPHFSISENENKKILLKNHQYTYENLMKMIL